MSKSTNSKTVKTSNTASKMPVQNPSKKVETKSAPHESGKWTHWILAVCIALFGVLLYSNTFQHRFVLDDHGIIKNNKITKAPVSWENTKIIFSTPLRKGDFSDLENSLYRPVVKLLFNLEWNISEGDPHFFHKVNVLLYAISGMFLFFVLYHALERRWLIPFMVSLIFMAHPIHTEVVANIKSGDEILSLLGVLMALRCLQLYVNRQKMIWIGLGVAAYLIGSFSKESTVVAVALVPLFLYSFTQATRRQIVVLSSIMLSCSLFFLVCRHFSLSGYPPEAPVSALDNYLVMCDDPSYAGTSRFASAINTLGLYLKVFLYPHPLSCDYSFASLVPVGYGDPGFLISMLILLALAIYAVRSYLPLGEKGKVRHTISFGILWFFITISITSNVFFLIGTSFGERLFYLPSLGVTIALTAALVHFFQKQSETTVMQTFSRTPVLAGLLAIILIGSSYKTVERNKDWKSDFGLFSRDVQYFPESTHLLFYMGNHLSGDEFKQTLELRIQEENLNINLEDSVKRANQYAIRVFNKALSIYPALPSDGYNQLGKAYYNLGQIDSAYKYYLKAYNEDSTNPIFTNNLGTTFYNASVPLTNLGVAYQQKGMLDSANYYIMAGTQKLLSALPYFLKAHKGDSMETDFINNIGCIYGATQRPDSAIFWFLKAHKIDSLDLTAISFLDITYRNMGKISEADYYKQKFTQAKLIRQQELK